MEVTAVAGRAHEHLVDAHVGRPGDRVEDRVGDVLGLEQVARSARASSRCLDDHRVLVVALKLGVDEAWLYAGDAHVDVKGLLAKRLGESDDAELGHVVDGSAERRLPAGGRGDVDDMPATALAHDRQRRVGASRGARAGCTSIIRRQCSVSAPATGPSSITPALLIRMSTLPSSSLVRSTSARACASSERSVSIASAVPPWRRSSRRARRSGPSAEPPAPPTRQPPRAPAPSLRRSRTKRR